MRRQLAAESVWDRDRRLPALDAVRGLAILLVIFFHHTQMRPSTPPDELVIRAARFGWIGVDLFLVLSGFLITNILYRSKGSPRYFRSFYARRTLRIFPIYYATIAFSLYVLPRLWPESDLASLGSIAMQNRSSAWYWLYAANFLVAMDGFMHPILAITWSLAIEEQFYLVWAVVVRWLDRRRLIWICLALVALTPALRVWLLAEGAKPAAIYVWTFTRMDTLAVGALLALALRDAALERRLARAAPAALIAGGAAIAALVALEGEDMWGGPLTQSIGYTAIALFFGALLVTSIGRADAWPRSVAASRFLAWFGAYSYALYLWHVPIRRVVRDSYYGAAQFPTFMGSPLPGQLLFYVVATVPATLAAWISWHTLEKHVLALKRFFPYR